MSANPLIVALDVPTVERALELARQLKGHADIVKVGYPLFIQGGTAFIESLMAEGLKVFLDLKFHDIPNTVSNAVKSVMKNPPFMLTLHTSGGTAMMAAAVQARDEVLRAEPKTKLLGVTVLTSIDHIILGRELRVMGSVEAHVSELSWMAKQSGLDGVVASSHEIVIIRQRCGLNSASGLRSDSSRRSDFGGGGSSRRSDFGGGGSSRRSDFGGGGFGGGGSGLRSDSSRRSDFGGGGFGGGGSGASGTESSANGKGFLIVVPGIRPVFDARKDDQKRTMSPGDAIRRGADYLVIGRPIIEAPDPVKATETILEEIQAFRPIRRRPRPPAADPCSGSS